MPAEQISFNTASAEDADEGASITSHVSKPTLWPKDAVAQVRAVIDVLAISPTSLLQDEIAARFTARGAWKKRQPQLLDMLVALGRAQEQGGRYRASD